MICPMCKGERTLLQKDGNTIGLGFCPKCGGSGEVEMTNAEYLRQASTEDLAEFILIVIEFSLENSIEVWDYIKDSEVRTKEYWIKWLGEKRDEK